MSAFEISSTYQIQGTQKCYSFKGFFTLNEKQEIIGYLVAMDPIMTPQKRYIYGTLDDSRLVYLQLANTSTEKPLMFAFPDIRKNGVWSVYDEEMEHFFPHLKANGIAQVSLREITNPANVQFIAQNVFSTFRECTELVSNLMLIHKGIRPYMVDLGIY